MLIETHCFLKKVRITNLPITFEVDGMSVELTASPIQEDEGLQLKITEPISPDEIRVPVNNAERDNPMAYLEPVMRKYKAKLQTVSYLIEGFLATNYNAPAPAFETDHIVANIRPENGEEQRMIRDGVVSGGFGNIQQPEQYPSYTWENGFVDDMVALRSELPALSFIAQATRADARKDTEIAFVLYFRIIEGYFGDGTPNIERAFRSRLNELETFLPYDEQLRNAFQTSLQILNLPSRANNDYRGMITDLVLLRHKLAHFDNNNADRHFQPDLKFNLDLINRYLRVASMRIILDRSRI